jgi:hypothetical protein
MAAWQDGPDYPPQVPDYPARQFLDYLERSFGALKREQVKLLRAIAETSQHPLTNNSAEISLISDGWQDSQRIIQSGSGGLTPNQGSRADLHEFRILPPEHAEQSTTHNADG